MKNIDFKSMFIGVLSCTCLFLVMAQAKSDSIISKYNMQLHDNSKYQTENTHSQIGRYQITSNSQTRMLYLLDTITGKTYASIYGEEWIEEIDELDN